MIHKSTVIVAIVLVLGSLFSMAGFIIVQKMEQQRIHHEFQEAAQERIWAVQKTMQQSLEVLHAIAAFYDASNNKVAPQEFDIFVTPFLSRHLYILALNWAPRVFDGQRADFETAAQIDYPNFRLIERNAQRNLVKASQREEYFPIYYRVSCTGLEQVRGLDLASDSTLLTALNQARDSGTPQEISIALENTQQVSIFVPVFQKQSPINTLAQRREHLQGFIVGVLNIKDIVDSALELMPAKNIDIRLQDESLFETERSLAPPRGILYLKKTFEVAGRTWSILCTPAYPKAERIWLPFSILFAGLLFTILIVLYLDKSYKYTRRIQEEIVERRRVETALREAEKGLKDYSRSLEIQIAKRTDELAQQNIRLQQEIYEREQAEKALQK
ncbi:MAG: CHASE domain-containing protein [Pseudomonadota bacterium]